VNISDEDGKAQQGLKARSREWIWGKRPCDASSKNIAAQWSTIFARAKPPPAPKPRGPTPLKCFVLPNMHGKKHSSCRFLKTECILQQRLFQLQKRINNWLRPCIPQEWHDWKAASNWWCSFLDFDESQLGIQVLPEGTRELQACNRNFGSDYSRISRCVSTERCVCVLLNMWSYPYTHMHNQHIHTYIHTYMYIHVFTQWCKFLHTTDFIGGCTYAEFMKAAEGFQSLHKKADQERDYSGKNATAYVFMPLVACCCVKYIQQLYSYVCIVCTLSITIYTYVYIHVCIPHVHHARQQFFTYMYIHTYIHTYAYIHMHACECICIFCYLYMYVTHTHTCSSLIRRACKAGRQ
jgi:hypothetical protein